MPKTSAAMRKAIAKYQNEKVDTITFRVPKGEKALFQECAMKKNQSLSEYITEAVREKMERETKDGKL